MSLDIQSETQNQLESTELRPPAAPRRMPTHAKAPNTKPGLGIEINEEEVRKHPFEQEIPQRVYYRDGAVGDW